MEMNINTIYIIIGVAVFLVISGIAIGLFLALLKLRKAMSRAEQAEAAAEIEEALKSFIVGAENKLSAFAAFLKTAGQKAGGVKEDVVRAQAVQYMQEHGITMSDEDLTQMIQNLVTFMNKKTPALEDKKEDTAEPKAE